LILNQVERRQRTGFKDSTRERAEGQGSRGQGFKDKRKGFKESRGQGFKDKRKGFKESRGQGVKGKGGRAGFKESRGQGFEHPRKPKQQR
jgi:hypothetical protein